MKLLYQFRRELGVGDAVVLKDASVQNWRIAEIEDNGVSPNPKEPPVTKVTVVCSFTLNIPNFGQPEQMLPLYLIRKAEEAHAQNQSALAGSC